MLALEEPVLNLLQEGKLPYPDDVLHLSVSGEIYLSNTASNTTLHSINQLQWKKKFNMVFVQSFPTTNSQSFCMHADLAHHPSRWYLNCVIRCSHADLKKFLKVHTV